MNSDSPPALDNSAPPDLVGASVARVEERIARLRVDGALPNLPAGEVARQFQGVAEAVEAQVVEAGHVDVQPVVRSSDYLTGGAGSTGSRARRIVVRLMSKWTVLAVPRLPNFARATTLAIEQLADRQQHIQNLVVEVQLDRLRALENRCAQLELEIERLRAGSDAT